MEKPHAGTSLPKYLALFEKVQADGASCLQDILGDYLEKEVMDSFAEIMDSVNANKEDTFTLVFDPTLVRGMGYYTARKSQPAERRSGCQYQFYLRKVGCLPQNIDIALHKENEKLIFKILKRGEKLKISEAESENDLADSGLRYDLTVPPSTPILSILSSVINTPS